MGCFRNPLIWDNFREISHYCNSMSVSHYSLLQLLSKTTTDFFPPSYTFARQALVIFSVLVLLKVVQLPGRRRRKLRVKSIVHTPHYLKADWGCSIITIYSAPCQGTVLTAQDHRSSSMAGRIDSNYQKKTWAAFFSSEEDGDSKAAEVDSP